MAANQPVDNGQSDTGDGKDPGMEEEQQESEGSGEEEPVQQEQTRVQEPEQQPSRPEQQPRACHVLAGQGAKGQVG